MLQVLIEYRLGDNLMNESDNLTIIISKDIKQNNQKNFTH